MPPAEGEATGALVVGPQRREVLLWGDAAEREALAGVQAALRRYGLHQTEKALGLELQRRYRAPGPTPAEAAKPAKAFDVSRYPQRKVALHVMYLGAGFQGLSVQKHTKNTVEELLFVALAKTRLVQPGARPSDFGWSRCGRTDAGVSAFGQVLGVRVRSRLAGGPGGEGGGGAAERRQEGEYDYCGLLNRNLPVEIRVLGWSPVAEAWDARFSCKGRHYKYFFVQDGRYNLDAMREACPKYVGDHDFRNFCKMDVLTQQSFVRSMRECYIEEAGEVAGRQVYAFNVKGRAFLWHQVRCMVAVLFLIGEGHEEAGIIDEMLDVARNPRKPQYKMAREAALVLYECFFDDGDLDWVRHGDSLAAEQRDVGGALDAAVLRAAVWRCFAHEVDGYGPADAARPRGAPKKRHKPLRARGKEPTYEERLVAAEAKRSRRGAEEAGAGGPAGRVEEGAALAPSPTSPPT